MRNGTVSSIVHWKKAPPQPIGAHGSRHDARGNRVAANPYGPEFNRDPISPAFCVRINAYPARPRTARHDEMLTTETAGLHNAQRLARETRRRP